MCAIRIKRAPIWYQYHSVAAKIEQVTVKTMEKSLSDMDRYGLFCRYLCIPHKSQNETLWNDYGGWTGYSQQNNKKLKQPFPSKAKLKFTINNHLTFIFTLKKPKQHLKGHLFCYRCVKFCAAISKSHWVMGLEVAEISQKMVKNGIL